jgi:hypothetical protein
MYIITEQQRTQLLNILAEAPAKYSFEVINVLLSLQAQNNEKDNYLAEEPISETSYTD